MKLKVTRRHLLKGSLAAPLVMTVRSASATGWAMSSAGACRIRDGDRAKYEQIYKFRSSEGADEWLRAKVDICALQRKNSKGVYVDVSGEYFKGNTGCYWQMQKVTGGDCTITQKHDMTDANCRVKKILRSEYGLVACDENGYVKGFAWEQTSYSPITCSCWTSVKFG